jgi:hypothetical protein
MVIQNDTEFEATPYRLTHFEKVVCGLRHELSAKAVADCVQGYMIEVQRMREDIDHYLLRPLKAPVSDKATLPYHLGNFQRGHHPRNSSR